MRIGETQMLEHAELLFEDRRLMLDKLKKPVYERNMNVFRKRHGAYLAEMLSRVEESKDKEKTAAMLAEDFTNQVKKAFSVRGKIKGRMQVELNAFMIYYVFPAILLAESEDAILLADHVRDTWNANFKGSQLQYAGYQEIYDGFRSRLFGI